MSDPVSPQFTRNELLALAECYTAACLGPNAPGIPPALQDDAGIAAAKIESALFASE